jgi:hypothetical protein
MADDARCTVKFDLGNCVQLVADSIWNLSHRGFVGSTLRCIYLRVSSALRTWDISTARYLNSVRPNESSNVADRVDQATPAATDHVKNSQGRAKNGAHHP